MPRHKRQKRLSPEEVENIRQLSLSGKTAQAIHRKTGVSQSKVYQIQREDIPRLRIQNTSVATWIDGQRVGRYATVEVAAISKAVANDCTAWVEDLTTGAFFPLHWAGDLYGPEESSPQRKTVDPRKPARLDIAFALPRPCETSFQSTPAATMTSGQVSVISGSGIVSSMDEVPWGKGCWLAQQMALYRPDTKIPAYRRPGEYRIKVTVDCPGGAGDSISLVLKSPVSWDKLEITPLGPL